MSVAALYVRTSDGNSDGLSLDAQAARCRAYATVKGFTEMRLFSDPGVSGAVPMSQREASSRMLAAITAKEIHHVVAVRLDRLFRDTIDCLSNIDKWHGCGVSLHLIDLGGQSVDSRSALGRFALMTLAGVAQLERELISERTSAALRHKIANGERVGAPPYGYAALGDGTDWVAVPEEQAVIRDVLKLRSAKLSFDRIAQSLNRRKVPTKQGGKWHAATVRSLLNRAAA